MHLSIPLLILSLIYTVMIASLFAEKKKVKNIETSIFSIQLIVTIIGIILDLLGVHANLLLPSTSFFRWLVVKLYLIYLITFVYLITLYLYSLLKKKNKFKSVKQVLKNNKHFIFIYIISILIIFILPILYFNEGKKIYVYGPCCIFTYAMAAINVIGWLVVIIINYKRLDKSKIDPIIVFITISIAVMLFQLEYPECLLATNLTTFITVYMYHTIENPDIKLLKQVELAKEQAEQANKAKSDFLSSMSHEIRTPLNAIVGLSNDIIENDDGVSKVVLDDAKDIVEASNTLLEIVGNILDISKIESGKLEITSCKYNFKQELETLAKINKVRIGEKNIDYKVEIAPDIPYELIGDRVHIKEILNNLISNAIKYTESGKVLIRAKCINQKDRCNLIVSVQDTGRGIKKEDINKLFTKFERLNVERNTTIEGTGLGLAITKQLVEMMGGKINVQSNYGFGSMFVVNIPQKISIMNKPIDEDTLVRTGRLFSKDVANNKLQGSKVNDIGHKKVLLVDDNNLNLKVAHKAMQNFDFEIVDAHDGEEAIEIYNKTKDYDIIFMDIMMPNMGGETALRNLKLDPTFKTPVIALTADAVEGSSEKYISEGFKDYLAKPFSKEDINDVINKLF